MSEGWYYVEDDSTIGPISLDELQSSLRRRREASRVLVWQEGLQDWTEAGSIPELARAVAGPPPLPQRSVQPGPPNQRAPLSSKGAKLEKASNKVNTVISWIVIAISVVLSRVIGGAYWMPVLLIGLSFWILTKLKLSDYTAWMLGVLVGHTLWMIIGYATVSYLGKPNPDFAAFIFDLVVVPCLTVWVIRTQSAAAAASVLIYQLVVLAANVVYFDENVKISAAAPFMHIAFRALGVGLAVYAIVRARRFEQAKEIPSATA
jgi:GYF domain 2